MVLLKEWLLNVRCLDKWKELCMTAMLCNCSKYFQWLGIFPSTSRPRNIDFENSWLTCRPYLIYVSILVDQRDKLRSWHLSSSFAKLMLNKKDWLQFNVRTQFKEILIFQCCLRDTKRKQCGDVSFSLPTIWPHTEGTAHRHPLTAHASCSWVCSGWADEYNWDVNVA